MQQNNHLNDKTTQNGFLGSIQISYHSPIRGRGAGSESDNWVRQRGGGSTISDITCNIQFLFTKTVKSTTNCIKIWHNMTWWLWNRVRIWKGGSRKAQKEWYDIWMLPYPLSVCHQCPYYFLHHPALFKRLNWPGTFTYYVIIVYFNKNILCLGSGIL